jgi:MFS family permease
MSTLLHTAFGLRTGLSARKTLSLAVVISTAFIWFFVSSMVLDQAASSIGYFEDLSVLATNFGATAAAALLGASLSSKHGHVRFLKIWMLVGAVVSIAPLVIDMTNPVGIEFIAFLWGATLGFGMPAVMGYFTEETNVENRGRVGAIAFFATFVGIFLVSSAQNPLGYEIQVLILGGVRIFGFLAFLLQNHGETTMMKIAPSYLNIIQERSFLLYFSAWALFSLVNYVNVPILNKHFGADFIDAYAVIEAIIMAVFALLGGILSDIVGRKVVVISGFIMLGLGYAALGAFPWSLVVWYFYTVVDGIAWGMLGVVFFMTLWADLAHEMSSMKYFALGGIPLLLSGFLQKLVGPDLAASVSVTAVFSLGSFFLFLAVLPLLYAPETLPERNIKKRELKSYIEKAKRTKEKYTQ